MGLIGGLLQRSLSGLVWTAEMINEAFDHPLVPPPPHSEQACLPVDEGPDDLWPEDSVDIMRGFINQRLSEPEILVGEQWGLRLPSGEVCWNVCQGTHLNNPIDRVQMIARIQQTALDAGFSQEQLVDFMANYTWVTRKQIASVTYEDLQSYPLTDPQVSEMPSPTPAGGTEEEEGSP